MQLLTLNNQGVSEPSSHLQDTSLIYGAITLCVMSGMPLDFVLAHFLMAFCIFRLPVPKLHALSSPKGLTHGCDKTRTPQKRQLTNLKGHVRTPQPQPMPQCQP